MTLQTLIYVSWLSDDMLIGMAIGSWLTCAIVRLEIFRAYRRSKRGK